MVENSFVELTCAWRVAIVAVPTSRERRAGLTGTECSFPVERWEIYGDWIFTFLELLVPQGTLEDNQSGAHFGLLGSSLEILIAYSSNVY